MSDTRCMTSYRVHFTADNGKVLRSTTTWASREDAEAYIERQVEDRWLEGAEADAWRARNAVVAD